MPPSLQKIDGRYRVRRLLGEGMSGEVYLVDGPEGSFALKLLKPFADHALAETLVGAFKFEFAFLKDLRHPNVVRIQDFGFDEALHRFYFTEEFLEGQAIGDYCRGADPDRIAGLFLQAIGGLQAIHRAHLLHGDLKSNNLLVVEGEGGPVIKLIDLGLADPRFPFTAGTPSTMAPEKILKEPVDERSDLYSLGVVFYQLFTGENPFARESLAKTYEAHLTVRAPKLTLKNPRVSAYWNEIFETLLAKNPAHRYRSCAELLAAIHFARPTAKEAKPSGRPWRPERWIARGHLLDELTEQLRAALRQTNPSVFLLTGEAGAGKSRMAQELKYRFQMEQVKIFAAPGPEKVEAPPTEPCPLWILDEWPETAVVPESFWEAVKAANPSVLLIGVTPEGKISLTQTLPRKKFQVVDFPVPPFTREELADFLRELCGVEKIPENFLNGLWEKTRGNPRLVVSLLEHLVERQRLVDAQGRWNLAIFQETDFDFEACRFEIPEIDQALGAVPASDHRSRAELWIKRAEELLKGDRLEEMEAALRNAEAESHQVEGLSVKLQLRSAIYEREGVKCIRQQQFEAARARFERALALLEESESPPEALRIRIQNYIAWLLCQEGKVDAAIDLFKAAQARWERLPPEEQDRVLNFDLGYAYLQKGNAELAVAEFTRRLPSYERAGDPPSLMKALYNLAEAHLLAKDYAKAIEYFQRGSELMRLHRNFEFLLRAYNGLGKTYHLKGEWEPALRDYGRGLELANYLEDYSSAAALAQNIGSIQVERGDFAEAQQNFELALKLLKKLPEKNAYAKYLQCRALVELGDLFRRQGRFAEAEGFARDADQLALQEESLATFRFWVLLTQAEIGRDQGDQEKLQDALANLLPMVDDEEKRARCAALQSAFSDHAESRGSEAGEKEIQMTKLEKIQSAPPQAGALQALLRINRWLATERDPERLLTLILRQAGELSGAEAGLLLLETEPGRLEVKASVNLQPDEGLARMSQSIALQVLSSGEPVLAENALDDERFNSYDSVIDLQLRSLLAVPVRSQEKTLGVMALVHRHRVQAFSNEMVELLKAFADQAGIALENARLVAGLEAARRELSGQLEQAHEELDRARNSASESSVLLRFAKMNLVSQNPAMRELFRTVERIRDTDLSIVLYGESGTGKELLARSLHDNSRRHHAPFVAVNCAALPAALIEGELFGYKAGAFTGATRDKPGLIETAEGGTLFLDEIAELEIPLQAKLLRVLQEREVTRLGETRPRPVRFRLVSASHRRLRDQIAAAKFREDLFYRVAELELSLPPLRERKEDIPLLAQFFIDRYLREHGEKKAKGQLGRDLLKAMLDYPWPGNVRELENVTRVATALRGGEVLRWKDLPESVQLQLQSAASRREANRESAGESERRGAGKAEGTSGVSGKSLGSVSGAELFDPKQNWREIETLVLAKTLRHFDFDVKRAAGSLGCAPSKLYQRMRESRITAENRDWDAHPFVYAEGRTLQAIKRQVFAEALGHCGGSPYQAARVLGVSPGMVYQWTGES